MSNGWLLLLYITLALPAAGHALIFKKDSRSALGWVAICLAFPLAGPTCYFFFGVNRIRSRARKLEEGSPFKIEHEMRDQRLIMAFQIPPPLDEIARVSDAVIRRPLIAGNTVVPLVNGEAAYPVMMSAIETAEKYLYLSTYIFETRRTGRAFIDALCRARDRGVDVRVIVDGVGECYSIPRAGRLLARRGIRFARFLPPSLYPPAFRINLRNHRKILVADGKVAFVGGMNIHDSHLADRKANRHRIIDLHFQLTGPIATQIEHVFLEDWRFATGESLTPGPVHAFNKGSTICRAVVDGPNMRIDRLEMLLFCAVSFARKSISIMTPYFLPSSQLIGALQAAALKGVDVRILLPGKNNLPFVHWAAMRLLPDLLERGVRIFFQPPPFVHTKLILIDHHYAQVGSANLDTRSLRLNFELMVEIYGRSVSRDLLPLFESQRRGAREISLEEMQRRPLLLKLRDSFFWLFKPYL
ncbi:phospholipase D-like domain-containing protein [Desulfococcus sp.]|uniref:phospholipase D-like domain-containing protein n=1 Tax=Desulfococcus sp. TaxID=2025834 RepID=UPI003593265A